MEKMIPLKDLMKGQWWELLMTAITKRQQALANKIIYWDCMDVKDSNITQSDLLRAEMRCLAWVKDRLPKELVENPNYDPEAEELPEIENEAELIDNMFKQEM